MNTFFQRHLGVHLLGLLCAALLVGCGGGRDPVLGADGSTPTTSIPATTTTIPTPDSPPLVTAVVPLNNATGVAVNLKIMTIAFSEQMAAIDGTASVVVSCSSPCTSPATTVALDSTLRTAVVNLPSASNLDALTTYTVTVTAARSLSTGLPLAAPYVWSFQTAASVSVTRPAVLLTVPVTTSPGPTQLVAIDSALSATFSKDMNPSTLNTSSFLLGCASPCTAPAGTVTYGVGDRTVNFIPATTLSVSTTYTATILATATDLSGNGLAGNQGVLPNASNYVWTFKTVNAATTVSQSISVSTVTSAVLACSNSAINAVFTVPSGTRLDPTAATAAQFKLVGPSPASTTVTPASVSLDALTGHILSFTPLVALSTGKTYTATLVSGTSGVKDLAVPGNTLASNYSWTVTVGSDTSACLVPIVLGAATPFGTLGGSAGMTNAGISTIINGDIGTTAVSTAVTGFHDTSSGCIYTETGSNIGTVNGLIYTAAPPPTVACPQEGTAATAAVALAARNAALIAYTTLAGMAGLPAAGNLAGLTLTPGVYTAPAGSFMIVGGDLTLDAQGNANAIWVFQMATTLTVGGPGAAFPQSVLLINGAQAKNVYWQVGSAATVNAGGGGTMVGTIISQSGVAFSTAGASALVTMNGRALSLGASVTLVNTVINVPAP